MCEPFRNREYDVLRRHDVGFVPLCGIVVDTLELRYFQKQNDLIYYSN